MKRYAPFFLLIFCIFCGCASLKVERTVSNNTFSSSFPKVAIKVDEAFSYLGEKKHDRQNESYTGTTIIRGEEQHYIFVNAEGNKIRRIVSIEISRTQYGFVRDLFIGMKNKLDEGECKMGGHNYQYAIRILRVSTDAYLTRYILEKGYIMPNDILIKEFARLTHKDTVLAITYLEDFSAYDKNPAGWKDEKSLTPNQREVLNKFNENCTKSFAVLK